MPGPSSPNYDVLPLPAMDLRGGFTKGLVNLGMTNLGDMCQDRREAARLIIPPKLDCFTKTSSEWVGDSGSSSSFARIYGTKLSASIRLQLWDLVFSNRGAGGKSSSLQDATGCRLRLLQHFCWLSLRHGENPLAVTTPSKLQAPEKELWVNMSQLFWNFNWMLKTNRLETAASCGCPFLSLFSAGVEALLARIGPRWSLCSAQLLVSWCLLAFAVPPPKATRGVCGLRRLQQMGPGQRSLWWRFVGGSDGCLDFLPLQHGQDMDAVQAGSSPPRCQQLNKHLYLIKQTCIMYIDIWIIIFIVPVSDYFIWKTCLFVFTSTSRLIFFGQFNLDQVRLPGSLCSNRSFAWPAAPTACQNWLLGARRSRHPSRSKFPTPPPSWEPMAPGTLIYTKQTEICWLDVNLTHF